MISFEVVFSSRAGREDPTKIGVCCRSRITGCLKIGEYRDKRERRVMIIRKDELLNTLVFQISEAERRDMETGAENLIISAYNRRTIRRMLSLCNTPTDMEVMCGDAMIDSNRVEALKKALVSFLNRYMADQPEGHKWIIICCIFLSFIAEEPMHPQEVVHWVRDGKHFFCSYREDTEGSLCRWCVSEKQHND